MKEERYWLALPKELLARVEEQFPWVAEHLKIMTEKGADVTTRALELRAQAETKASQVISAYAHSGESYARIAEGFCVCGEPDCIRCGVAGEIAYAIRQHARAFGR